MSIFDNLATAFKGGGSSRVPITRGHISPWAVAIGHADMRQGFEYRGAVDDAYMANPVAQRAVRIISESIGGAPVQTDNVDLSRLVLASCGTQPLLEVIAAQLALHGNAYVQIMRDGAGVPVELFPLRPDRVTVNAGKDGWPASYRYRLDEQVIDIPLEDEDGWPCIIHLKGFNPLDDHYGAGCLRAAHQAVAIHNAASDWNRALLENAARPSGALVYESEDAAGLTPAQFDRLKEELNEVYQGSANAGRPMLLEGGLSWQSMSLSPADMDFATLKSAAARDIALAFGVPPMLLGLPGDNTYANYREANRALWRLTLLPLAKRLLDGLMTGLGDWFPDATIAVDLDQVPALSEDRERYWSQISDADFLTNDEKRKLLGFAAKGDDQ
ncbi:phage portal protein [Erythrobacter sp. W53]|uniref:phage portal protein n=1 Tax=Erythrobacteraceae TaxID=335929 RepID=UPI0036D343CC